MKLTSMMACTFLLTLSACALTSGKVVAPAKSEFLGGGITLFYSKNGELEGISSKATAPVLSKLQASIDQAVSVATVKSRRQIAEFLDSEVNSERFITTLSQDLQQSSDSANEINKMAGTNIAVSVRDSIRQRSNQILKGTVVEAESYDPSMNIVTVTVRAGTKERNASELVKGLFNR